MKQLFYSLFLSVLLFSSCSQSDDVTSNDSNIFTIGGDKLNFSGAIYVDYGYDIINSGANETYEYMMSFSIADKPVTKSNLNNADHFNYVLSIFFSNNGKTPHFGRHNFGRGIDSQGQGAFLKKGFSEEIRFTSGFFIIEDLGGGKFSLEIDGVMSNSDRVVGKYMGVFEKMSDSDFD